MFSCRSALLRGRFLVRVRVGVRVFLIEFFFAWTRVCLRGRVRVYFLVHFLFFFYKFPAQDLLLRPEQPPSH